MYQAIALELHDLALLAGQIADRQKLANDALTRLEADRQQRQANADAAAWTYNTP